MQVLKKTVVSSETNDSKSLDFSIKQNGNLVLNCLNSTYTMARNSLENSPALLEKVQNWQVQVEPEQTGVSVRVAYRF